MKISLITITYNSEETLEDTILSVIKQKYSNIEYIIVDGGSNDGTLAIIEKYKKYISILISEPDKGISDAFNKGIKAATGDVIGIVNSDDFLASDVISAVAAAAEKERESDVFYGNSIMFSDKNAYTYKPGPDLTKLLLYMVISHPATFIKKSAYDQYGMYDLNYKCAMDFELLSKMYSKGAKFKYLDKTLTCFRLGGISKRKSLVTKQESCKVAIRNGENPTKVKLWYGKIRFKSQLLDFLNKYGIENTLRLVVKKQKSKDVSDLKWFLGM